MAYLIPSFTHPDNGVVTTNAYARVNTVKINPRQKAAIVQFDYFGSAALRAANKTPIYQQTLQFSDATVAGQYTNAFTKPAPAAGTTPAPALNADDILSATAYLALKNHPATVAILAAATAT